MLVTMKSILDKAKKGGYGVAAPNVGDSHTVMACLQAAVEENSPIIIDFNEGRPGTPVYIDFATFGKFALPLMRDCPVPVAVNLDHGKNYATVMKAIRAGFTSVMIDCSDLPYEENVKNTKEVVEVAHLLGVSVEAELGAIGKGLASGESPFTEPDEAKKFVEETGIDMLAVAVGTTHGQYKGEPKLDFERIKKISETLTVPLVLHGGSFTGYENLQKAVQNGINKINLATDLFTSGTKAMRACLENPEATWQEANIAAAKGYKDALIKYMRAFNCSGKA